MSANSLIDCCEIRALTALSETGAIKACPHHPQVVIQIGDADKEKRAYGRATNALKKDDAMFMREDVMAAIQDTLDGASEHRCATCDARYGF